MHAIIPAAGHSSRMSGFKPLLPLGDEVVVERLIRLLRDVGARRIVVVCGHRAGELEPVVRESGGEAVRNPKWESGMFSSVLAGLQALEGEEGHFFLLPVDVMLVRRDTLQRLAKARTKLCESVLHPIFQGRRGHPPLIPLSLRDDIMKWSGGNGLAGYFAQRERQAVEIQVADERVRLDVDTGENYAKALDLLTWEDTPSRAECLALLDITPGVTDMGRRHSRAVARFALRMAEALNVVRGVENQLDVRLVEAAGLLHDIAKGLPDHERAGGAMLADMGYPCVGAVTAEHRDVDPPEERPLAEREVVFLADKLVQGDRLVPVRRRFQSKMEQQADDPEEVEAIKGRMERALRVQELVEDELGGSVERVAGKGDPPG
ncbi:DVU_1551 family NTP transferase [Desulfohalovibrio reitneri]|uniref:DVU_1551 family NTP transferase n=1 Tax=Desulfohalovibrio reitneri TaxID=1307759 RepID=UPI0023513255|nr:NTP transferase domain-containing protein [Desulfohalovibrio reitneri]